MIGRCAPSSPDPDARDAENRAGDDQGERRERQTFDDCRPQRRAAAQWCERRSSEQRCRSNSTGVASAWCRAPLRLSWTRCRFQSRPGRRARGDRAGGGAGNVPRQSIGRNRPAPCWPHRASPCRAGGRSQCQSTARDPAIAQSPARDRRRAGPSTWSRWIPHRPARPPAESGEGDRHRSGPTRGSHPLVHGPDP